MSETTKRTDWMVRIAVCDRRTDRRYRNMIQPWSWLRERNQRPIRTSETAVEYPRLPKEKRDDLKDQGGFVGGWLKEGIRKNGNVMGRQVVTLDADSIPEETDFVSLVRKQLEGCSWFLYSTHKHTPQQQRYRIVILLDREVTEEEYPPLARMIASGIGMNYFDDTTYQASRMMYWASCPRDGAFVFEESEGEPLCADRILGQYGDWRDTMQWPTSGRQQEAIRKTFEKQQDPLKKEGMVGVFCREYFPIQKAMETFLGDVYEPTDRPGRWDYKPSESAAGVVLYEDRFVYSNHATDPACGQLLNAFDLVRVHRFGEEDGKTSFKKMCDFALEQDAVRSRMRREKEEASAEELQGAAEKGKDSAAKGKAWLKKLVYNKKTMELKDSVANLKLILENDPDLANFAKNDMADRVEVKGSVPWSRSEGNQFWDEDDESQLKGLLDSRYIEFSERTYENAFRIVTSNRRFHPVRAYLEGLPSWDGVPRVETLLIRCFEAEDSPYVRAVTRKTLAAAVARVYEPGIKFDSMLVLDGRQGIGKSTLFRKLAGDDWFADTLSLTDMQDKSAAEKIQGVWITEIGELAGMRKADIEKVKAFLSCKDDFYRPAYGKMAKSHKRQGILTATVNGDYGYLRDSTGNRRFWVVKCRQKEPLIKWEITPAERDQLWAEAKKIYQDKEPLYLEAAYLEAAEKAQMEAMEPDDRQGMVESYLEMLLPANWDKMDLFSRKNFVSTKDDPVMPKGTVRRETVCNMEIWAECFGKPQGDMKTEDSRAIGKIMSRIKGWTKSDTKPHLPVYGRQRVYVRTDAAEEGRDE